MRAYAVYNPLERVRKAVAWVHYDPGEDRYAVEIREDVSADELPLMFALALERGTAVLGNSLTRSWLAQRIPPEDRDNIDELLQAGKASSYYIPSMIAMTKGRSSQDDFLLEEVPSEGYRTYDLNHAIEAPVQLGVQLSRARRAAGLTQMQLAEETGIQQAVISRIEKGKGNPTIETIEILARGCGRSLSIHLD